MEKIFVTIRVRPLSKSEAAKGSPWKLGPNTISLCNPSGGPVSGQSYTFDKVFGSESSTLDIYEAHTKDIIASAVQGFNGTVFAYGQTSSGKTYTMRGSPQEPGIIPLAVQEVFRNIQEAEDREFLLRVSYMEIYNEEINDLLAPENRKLQVHENLERGIFVAGLREEIVVSPEQVLELMTVGETYRHVGETNMNVYSSRSHTIFRMVIESRDRSQDDPTGPATVQACDAVRVSVLNLVDLAGSERVAKTGAEGARLKEGTHINKSLMTLGTVINKLSEGVEKQGGHVPYRDSKLTRILQPALGGNAKTAVICNITPALVHVDETRGTLFFASRANRVTNCAQVNEIMTDAALLKRQKREIEELRSKLQHNHSDHWEEEVLNLRNALLKIELDRERMALELQEEKKAQAERERRLKEQEQKIENLSTMVINSAVDDRDFEKRNKKNNRRETWCPRIPSAESNTELQEIKRPFPKESPRGSFSKSVLPTRRDRLPPMPPPFESLMEEEDMGSPLAEVDENTIGGEFQSIPSGGATLDSIFIEPPPVHFGERKRRSAEKSIDVDLKQQLGDLQVQYDDLQFEHELKMREKVLEMEELKKELAYAQSAANKARRLDDNPHQGPEERRGKSLDGWESDSNVSQLRAQVKNLELEKFYMQKELESITEQARIQATSAKAALEKLQQELEESRKEAAIAKLELSHALQRVDQLQKEMQIGEDQQAQLIASFYELQFEVEATKGSSEAFQVAAQDSTHALKADMRSLQESIVDVKSLKAALEKQFVTHSLSELAVLMEEHNALLGVLQTVQTERDAFCEVSKQAQADLKSLEEEISRKSKELEATEENLNAASEKILNAGNEVAELQLLLSQREQEQQALERKIRDLEGEALAAISEVEKEELKARIAELEKELEGVSQEKASLICKGEAMHATIQVLEGERDALMQTAKQAQADMDRLQAKRRQELKDAENKLESVLSETHVAREQLIAMRALLSQQAEEQQVLQEKFQSLQTESTSMNKAFEEKIQALEAGNSMTKEALVEKVKEFDSCRRDYEEDKCALERKMEELLACLEALNKEKTELNESCERSEVEIRRLCRELDSQGRELAAAEARLESARAQSVKDEKQISELHMSLLQRNDELEGLKRRVMDINAEKSAMETCLAGGSPESISAILMETSLQLSAAEQSLQLKVTELEKAKGDFQFLQESKAALETELAEAKTCTAAVEETLLEAVSALEVSSQEKLRVKMDLERSLEELSVKNAKLADLENECAALVDRLASIEVEMEEAKARLEQEVETHKASYEAVSQEKLELIEERKSLRSALVSMDEDREALSEQNFQAQNELKEFDVEVQRQRQEIELAESALKIAKDENMRVADAIVILEAALSQKTAETLNLQSKIQDMDAKISSLEENLATNLDELQVAKRREESLTSEYRSAQEQLAGLELLLSEKDEKIQELRKDLANSEAEYTGMTEEINSKVVEMEQLVVLTTAERAQLVEKHEGALVVLQKVEEERHGLFMSVDELREEVKQLKELLGDQETQLEDARAKLDAADSHVNDLQSMLAERTSEKEQAEQERDGSAKQMAVTEKLLRDELQTKTQATEAAVTKLEAANLEVLSLGEKLKQAELLLTERTEEKERVEREKDALSGANIQLQDMIESLRQELQMLQHELKEVESTLSAANCEIDDAGKQLNEVHALLSENHQERTMLEQKLEELEASKAALEKSLTDREAELTAKSEALSATTTKLEAFQQLHHTETSQLRSDILGLRKELKAAKGAPAALEKERDGLRKDMEKLKTKMGDVESKLKLTLIEKSKVETEKVNIDREVKQLRQSTALLNKRESIVDKRRESVACGLNKTKLQLSSTEHALQMKTNELEKTAFDLQLLQDNYMKLEADMSETEKASATLKEKLAEAEIAISLLREEKATAARSIEEITQELEEALEQRRVTNAQLEALQAEHSSLMEKLQACQVASEEAEASAKAIAMEKYDLAQQLTDAHFEFEEEKAAWASQADENEAKFRELDQEIVNLTEQLQQVQKAHEEVTAARDALQEQVTQLEQSLQESVQECLLYQEQFEKVREDASSASVALQEQVCKLEQCLESSAQETDHWKQQVEHLNSSLEKRAELQRKLEEQVAADKEQYEALEENCQKLEQLIAVSESTMNEETRSKADLTEETEQLKEMLHAVRQNCKDLQEQIAEAEATIQEETDARLKLLEDRQALTDMVQAHGERCRMLEEQIFKTQSVIDEEREAKARLSQQVHQLKERLQQTTTNVAQDTFEVNRRALEDRALQLEADCNSEREVASTAKKQVERLQIQLKRTSAELASLQTELDMAGMNTKSLSMEVDEMQAALDKASAEKAALRKQVTELYARNSSLQDMNEQLQRKEFRLQKDNMAYLTSKCKLQVALDATSDRLKFFQVLWEEKEDVVQELNNEQKIVKANLAAAKKDAEELRVELENLRCRCQRYEEEITQVKSKMSSPEEEQKRANQLAEVMQQNHALQLRLQKAKDSVQAQQEEIWRMHEVVKEKEESAGKLEAALEKAQGQVVKLEKELYLKAEPQTAQKPRGSSVFTAEVNTPVASSQGEGDWKHVDDTHSLYSSSLASRSKVEQLKLQSQSLLRKYKQPWRIQRSPGGSSDHSDAYTDHPPPPSATLHSRQENLTAPIPTWKKAKTAGATSNTDLPSVTVFSDDIPKASSYTTRSAQRAALAPVTQNKAPATGLERRLQALGPQSKLPVQAADEVESKPSLASLTTPREFRFNRRFEKENL